VKFRNAKTKKTDRPHPSNFKEEHDIEGKRKHVYSLGNHERETGLPDYAIALMKFS